MASGPTMKFDDRYGSGALVGELDVGEPPQQLAEHHVQLQPGERRAQAEVRAEAEREVRVRVAAQVEASRGSRTPTASRFADGYMSMTWSPSCSC